MRLTDSTSLEALVESEELMSLVSVGPGVAAAGVTSRVLLAEKEALGMFMGERI